jgi:hypothetical protein
MKLFWSLVLALGAGVAVAVLTAPGCAGSCGSNCPLNRVQIGSPDGAQLAIPNGGLAWSGPACPVDLPICDGNPTVTCTSISVYGQAQGFCDVTISFSDRPAEVVRAEFGPKITQGCCVGFLVAGPAIFFIPDSPNQGLIYADGGTDSVSIAPDGSADAADARAPDGSADAAQDSLAADAQ